MDIQKQYETAVEKAHAMLGTLNVAHGTPKNILGLSGWVFEQTIRSAIEKELSQRNIAYDFKEQVPIVSKSKVDLVVGNIAIEVKVSGFYSNVEEKYSRYRQILEQRGLQYFYVTLYEEYAKNIQIAERIFGHDKAFVLTVPGEWERFISQLVANLR